MICVFIWRDESVSLDFFLLHFPCLEQRNSCQMGEEEGGGEEKKQPKIVLNVLTYV